MSESTQVLAAIETGQPLSLYLDLQPGKQADLELVSLASIEFVRALREAVLQVSPDLQINVSLQNSLDGSLSINSFLKFIGAAKLTRAQVLILAGVFAGWFANNTVGPILQKETLVFWEHHVDTSLDQGSGQKELTPAQIKQIDSEIERINRSPEVQRHVGSIYRTIQKDHAVKGIGLKFSHERSPPPNVVPSTDFSERMLDAAEIETTKDVRDASTKETVRVITAILDPESKRKWVVVLDGKTISARMEDRIFVGLLNDGKIKTALHNNLQLSVQLKKYEEKIKGEWRVTSWVIAKVYSINPPNGTAESLSAATGDEEAAKE